MFILEFLPYGLFLVFVFRRAGFQFVVVKGTLFADIFVIGYGFDL